MNTDSAKLANPDHWFLSSLQVSDSFFPLGTYAVSFGLETLVQQNLLHNSSDMVELVKSYLELQIGPLDLVAMSHSYEATDRKDISEFIMIDEILYAMKLVKEFRESSVKMGRNLIQISTRLSSNEFLGSITEHVGKGETHGNYAVIHGAVAHAFGIPLSFAALSMLYSFTVGLLGAAVRLGALDYLEAQSTLQESKPVILTVVQENVRKSLEDMFSFSPMIDIAGLSHQRLETRMFMS